LKILVTHFDLEIVRS